MRKFYYLLAGICLLGCANAKLDNTCDFQSKDYHEQLIINNLLGYSNPPCLPVKLNTPVPVRNSIIASSPTQGYTLKNGTDSFTVRLGSQPNASVIVPIAVTNPTQVTASPSSLTFTNSNWDIPQTITLTGIDNLNYGVGSSFTVNLGPSVSEDSYAQNLAWTSNSQSYRDFRKLIFETIATTTGNLGGIAGADSFCNSDAAKPANTGNFKAFIVQASVRVASITANTGDGQIDWVLSANQLYTRTDGTVVVTTLSNATFGALTNSIGTNGNSIWTGINLDFTTSGVCGTAWDGTGTFAVYGVANATGGTAINGGSLSCANVSNLYCVQQ